MLWITVPLGLLYLLSSNTLPFLLCCFLSQRLPSPLLHILPHWTTVSAFLPAPWPVLRSGGACEKPVETGIAQTSWLCWDIAEVTSHPVSSMNEKCRRLGAGSSWHLGSGWEQASQSARKRAELTPLPVPVRVPPLPLDSWAVRCFPVERTAPERPHLPLLWSWFTPSWSQ